MKAFNPSPRFLFIVLLAACLAGPLPLAAQSTLPLLDLPPAETDDSSRVKAASCTVEIVASVPPGSGTVYITGNLPALGPWDPGRYAMEGGGDLPRRARLTVPLDYPLEFKLTLGDWEREAVTADGLVPQNASLVVRGPRTLSVTIPGWKGAAAEAAPPAPAPGDKVLGTLVDLGSIESKHLDHPRQVVVWLPPGYADEEGTDAANADHRYPVLYMHDGQNLFEPAKSFTGIDWGVDEAVVGLVDAGKIPPIIVVGVSNSEARSEEYDPFRRGEDYARFLIEELKPRIDAEYRTRPEATATGTMGSSLGGLIVLGLGWRHPDVFTRLGCVSAHLPPLDAERGGTGRSILDEIEASGLDRSLRIYLDQSTGGPDRDYDYDAYRKRFAAMLTGWGWTDGVDFMTRRYENTEHTERDWRARLPIALEFLFGDLAQDDQ